MCPRVTGHAGARRGRPPGDRSQAHYLLVCPSVTRWAGKRRSDFNSSVISPAVPQPYAHSLVAISARCVSQAACEAAWLMRRRSPMRNPDLP